jgi:2-methylcitrate dehydratase PrpD
MTDVTREIAEFAAASTLDRVDAAAVRAARRLLIESVAAAAFGSQLRLGRRIAAPLGVEGHGPAIPGSPAHVDVARSAFVNAAWTDCNDSAGGATKVALHPGKNVLPAVFSAWLASDRTGAQLLLASAIGIEVAYRLAIAMGIGHKLRGHYSDGTVGAIGAAVAVAKLHDLDAGETANAIGHACLTAPVTIGGAAMYASESRPLAVGAAASTGILAVDMAKGQVAGLDAPLDSDAGFLAALSGSGRADVAIDGLGGVWHLSSSYLKPYVGCRLTHVEREAALAIMREREIASPDIKGITLLHPAQDMPVVGHHAAQGDNAVAHSCSSSYLMANAVVHGDLGCDVLSPERMSDNVLHEYASRIRVEADSALTEAYARCAADPGARRRRPVRVVMVLSNGQSVSIDQDSAHGDPDVNLEMSDAELRDKFITFLAGAIAPVEASRLFDVLNSGDEAPNDVIEVLRTC